MIFCGRTARLSKEPTGTLACKVLYSLRPLRINDTSMTLTARINLAIESRTYRTLLAILGGYAFTVGFFALLSVGLALLGTSRIEGMWWGVLTSFLVYTLVVIWVAATTRPWRTTAILAGGSFVMIWGAPLLAEQLGHTLA